MSDQSIFLAYVEEFCPRLWQSRANDAVLADLPVDDPTWPPLSKAMASATGDGPAQGSFKGRLITVAGYINGADYAIGPWLDKFEAMLRKLYWYDASVFVLNSWTAPRMHLSYTADRELTAQCHTPNAKPCDRWTMNSFWLAMMPCDARDYVGPNRIVTPGERQ